ncbi:MAG: hypothetical protein LBO21_03655 [Synergistaceae bacterium]|jgi:N-dimethylarginine dimethylaminohydrolase|nr:hypothetical protein [Synergistaceae bacterium]
MIFPWQVSYDLIKPVMDLGFEIIENPNVTEVKAGGAINFVALEPGKILIPAGNPNTKKLLEDAGVECIEVKLTEIAKAWGAIHCMSAFLKRDPI